MLRVFLLGTFRVEHAGTPIADAQWQRRKAQSLLKLLALQPQQQIHKDQAMDLLWPTLSATAARNNLYRTLHHLRHVLEPALDRPADSRLLTLNNNVIQLGANDPVWIDATTFADLIRRSYAALDPIPLLENAIQLYRGPLLEADQYEEWAVEQREAYQHMLLDALLRLAAQYRQQHRLDRAIDTLRRALIHDPAYEPAHYDLIHSLASTGQRHAALQHYHVCVDRLAQQGLEPAPATIELHQRIAAGTFDHAATPGDSPTQPQTNLPAPLTPLIGRDAEVTHLQRLILDQHVRLVTVSGPAGVGKTRLSVHVAAQLHDQFRDGVWLVELATARTEAALLEAIAQVLHVSETSDRSLAGTLMHALRNKHLLLLLDNFEQLVAAAPLLTTLLGAASAVKIVVTSRAALRVYGEHELVVPPLALPAADEHISMDQIAHAPAVQLFVERARAIRTDFALSLTNAPTIAAICRRLDGLPLAIELAAARSNVLSPTMIRERLHQRLALTDGGARDLPDRQRSLRAALDWSFALLDPRQQRLLARLSVFVGGCRLGAIEAVCCADLDHAPAIDDVTVLLNNHLIQRTVTHDDRARFTLLETIHEYARDQLHRSGEAHAVAQRHAAFYRQFAHTANDELKGPDQTQWLLWLDEEQHNLRAALDWSLNNEPADHALQLDTLLIGYWLRRSYWREGLEWSERVLLHSASLNTTQRADALTGAMIFANALGLPERAHAFAQENLALCQHLGDRHGQATVLSNLGVLAASHNKHAEARHFFEQSLQLTRAENDRWGIAMTTNNLGALALFEGKLDQAQPWLAESLATFDQLQDTAGMIMVRNNLGWLALECGETDQGTRYFEQSLGLNSELGDQSLMLDALEGYAWLAEHHRQIARGIRLLAVSETLRESLGEARSPAHHERFQHTLAKLRRHIDPATFASLWSAGQALPLDHLITYALHDQVPAHDHARHEQPAEQRQHT